MGSSESIGLSGAGESVNASDGVTSTMASGRSDVTYISTEIMYRVCEFILNSDLSQEDATALFLIALEQVADIGVAAAQKSPVRDPHDHGFTVQGDLTVPVEVQAEAGTTGQIWSIILAQYPVQVVSWWAFLHAARIILVLFLGAFGIAEPAWSQSFTEVYSALFLNNKILFLSFSPGVWLLLWLFTGQPTLLPWRHR